jgi:BirA family biotin operon repressor/biotin-[acetyl-CoA-carboxylase] ligase
VLDTAYLRSMSAFAVTHVLPRVTSTNTYASEQIREYQHSTYACLADIQTQGRGRYGKQWLTSSGNINLSIAWSFKDIVQTSALSLAIGVLLADLLTDEYAIEDIQLKWPNDIVYKGSKLAGILVEILTREQYVIVGIGLNVKLDKDLVITQPVTDLTSILGQDIDINQLAAKLLAHLYAGLESFMRSGFSVFKDSWCHLDAFAGQEVKVLDNDKLIMQGVCAGVDARGALLVSSCGKLNAIDNSRYSLRLMD